MAIKQGSIFTPDKKKKLIDEIQRELSSVVDAIKEKGAVIHNTSGYIDTNGNSWENYEIQIVK